MYITFSLLVFRGSARTVEAAEQALFRQIGESFSHAVRAELDSAALSLVSVAEDQVVQNLMAAGDREALHRYLSPRYELIRDRVSQFHFHLAEGRTLLRMHAPDQWGDDIRSLRPIIAAALTLRTAVSGIDLGIHGLGFRVVVPVFQAGEYLGACEYGMAFDSSFLRKLEIQDAGCWGIFVFDNSGIPRFIDGSDDTCGCPLTDQVLELLQNGQPVWDKDCNLARAVALYPFYDYGGRVIGFIKAEISQLPVSDIVLQIRQRLLLFGVIMMVALVLVATGALRLMLAPLRSLVDHLDTVAHRISAGEVADLGTADLVYQEFGAIHTAVSTIVDDLRHREVLFQTIVEGIPGIVLYLDRDARICWANERAKTIDPEITGKQLHELTGGFFTWEDVLLSGAFFLGQTTRIEAVYDERIWLHESIPVPARDGQIGHVIRISSDITDIRQNEKHLRELNDTLEQRIAAEIQRRKEHERVADQQSRLASIGELAAGMAHEITQPLNAVSFALENLKARFMAGLLDQEYLTEKTRAVFDDIERVRRIIDHVRIFARTDPEEYSVDFSVNRCLENALALIGVQLATHGVDVVTEMDEAIQKITGNPFKYEQVILNLLTNSRDSIEERLIRDAGMDNDDPLPGCITVRIYGGTSDVVLEVQDNGIGISEETRNRAFDPFYTTKPQGKGTGLGLAISFGIVTEMGGRIELIPVDDGVIARVIIPAAGVNNENVNGGTG